MVRKRRDEPGELRLCIWLWRLRWSFLGSRALGEEHERGVEMGELEGGRRESREGRRDRAHDRRALGR